MRFSPQGKPVHGANGARENAIAGSAVGDDANTVLEPRFGGDEPWHGFQPGQTKRCSETGRQIRAGWCQHFLEKQQQTEQGREHGLTWRGWMCPGCRQEVAPGGSTRGSPGPLFPWVLSLAGRTGPCCSPWGQQGVRRGLQSQQHPQHALEGLWGHSLLSNTSAPKLSTHQIIHKAA